MTLPTPLEMSALGAALLVGAGLVIFFLKAVQIGLYMGIAGAFLLACAGVAYDYELMGEDKIKPQLAAAKADAAAADRDKEVARGNTERCQTALAASDAGMKEWSSAALKSAEAAKGQAAANAKAAADAAPRIQQLQADAAAKPKLMACEQERDLGKKALLEALKARRQPANPLPAPGAK